MAGTPEEDLLGWLEREEEHFGFSEFEDMMTDFEKARKMWYDEMGWDMTEEQFTSLHHAADLRYDELPSISINFSLREYKSGWVPQYRDVVSGRFVAGADVFNLLATIR